MNYCLLSFKKLICTICSAIIPYKPLRHKVRYALNPLNDKRVEKYFRTQYVIPSLQNAPLFDGEANSLNTKTDEEKEYIWQCWLQGKEQAPDIVKLCLQSVEKYKRKKQTIKLITADNYSDFVKLPPIIVKKWEKGIIGAAQFSDILRINLLAKYGGYWVDATCLLTAPIPEWISTLPMFMYRAYGEFRYTFIQSCFMYAKANNPITLAWCSLMEQLWTKENKLLHYFQLHLMFKALVRTIPQAKEEFLQIPIMSENDTQARIDFIVKGAPYSIKGLKDITDKTFIHKLTYKKHIPDEFYSFYLSAQQKAQL